MNPVASQLPPFYQRLQRVRRQLLRRRLLARLLASGLVPAAAAASGSIVAHLAGLQEQSALRLLAGCLLAWLTGAALLLTVALRRQPDPRALAAAVEARQEALLDSLNTAVEIVETPGAAANPFAPHVVRAATAGTHDLDFAALLIPARLRPPALLGMAAMLAGLLALGFAGPAGQRAWHALQDARRGVASGIDVHWDASAALRGEHLPLHITVNRWEQRAQVAVHSAGTVERHPASRARDGSFTHTLYALDAPLRLRVETPSLRSPWLTIEPLTPPSLAGLQVHIAPPAYTELPPETLVEPAAITAPAGSLLTFSARVRAADGFALLLDGAPPRAAQPGATADTWQVAHTATQSGTWTLAYANAAAERRTSARPLTVRADEPPLVAIIDPGKDTRLAPSATLFAEIQGADDYGIRAIDITFLVSGRAERQFSVLHAPDRPAEGWRRAASLPFILPLDTLDVGEGDLVSYWATITDNRQPGPQSSRSEIFFIEVFAPVEPTELDGMPMDQERIDLRPHIEELKRLLRLNHRAAVEDDAESRLALNQRLFTGYGRLREDVAEIHEQIRAALGGADEPFIEQVFRSVDASLATAARMVTRDAAAAAIEAATHALRELVAFENLLRQNTISRSEPASAEGDPGAGADAAEAQASDWQREWQALREALAATAALQDRQRGLNTRAGQAGDDGQADAAPLQPLAAEQMAVRGDTRAVGHALRHIPATEAIQASLDLAGRAMRGGAAALEDGNPQSAWREGLRAEQRLEDARRLLEDRIDAAAREAIRQLDRQAVRLAEDQRVQAAASRSAQAGATPGDGLAPAQQGLNQSLQDLLAAMRQLAGELPASAAAAARALQRQAEAARAGDPGTAMTRAANALLYEQFGPAARFQDQAAAGLDQLAQALGDSARLLPGLDNSQLQRILDQLAADQRDLLGQGETPATAERLEATRDLWSNRLRELADALGDDRLGAIAQALGGSQTATAASRRDTADLLDQAARQLEQYRAAAGRGEYLERRRQSAPPPDAYREQVETYFRRLAEELP
jgi:hypothetical protein